MVHAKLIIFQQPTNEALTVKTIFRSLAILNLSWAALLTPGSLHAQFPSQGDDVTVMARKRWLARKPGTVRMSLAICCRYQTCQSASRAGLRKSISTM